MGDNVIDIKEGFDILKLNITKNFSDIKKINFFVDAQKIYQDFLTFFEQYDIR